MTISSDKSKAVTAAMGQNRKTIWQGRHHEVGRPSRGGCPRHLFGLHRVGPSLGYRRASPWPRHRDLRSRVIGQDDTCPSCRGQRPEKGRNRRLHRCCEHALDTVYARKLGVNCDELLVSQPDTGEQALEIVDMLVRSGAIDVMVIDSVAALVPRAEIEGEMGDAHMGLQARLMSQALRKLTATIGKTMTSVIFINQIRMKIGVMFGNPETTTGGNALEVLLFSPIGHPSHRFNKRRSGGGGQPDPCQGGEKQDGTAFQRGGVRYHVRGRDFPGRRSARCGRERGHHR